MRVKTLHKEDLKAHCTLLQEKVSADFRPDLIVGIASGGVIVAEQMFRSLPHISVDLRRPGTATKSRMAPLMRIVRRFPERLRNGLRIAEARLLAAKTKKPSDAMALRVEVPSKEFSNILVVDDAVDSGVTLQTVLKAVRAACPGTDIRSAAITVTTTQPIALPDYYIYNNQTLLRFPWSNDYQAAK